MFYCLNTLHLKHSSIFVIKLVDVFFTENTLIWESGALLFISKNPELYPQL